MNYQNLIINNITLYHFIFYNWIFSFRLFIGRNSAGAGNFDGDFTMYGTIFCYLKITIFGQH